MYRPFIISAKVRSFFTVGNHVLRSLAKHETKHVLTYVLGAGRKEVNREQNFCIT